MAYIVYSKACYPMLEAPINHNARMVPKPQFVNGNEGSVVRIDVLIPSEHESTIGGKKIKHKAQMMHTAYWLDPDEALALAEALKASATLAKFHDNADDLLFENIRLQGFLNGQ